jgi:PBP1b-binding outer membrane lipoprotein LpoB
MTKISAMILIWAAMLTGCAGMPVCPEIKLAMCPAQVAK